MVFRYLLLLVMIFVLMACAKSVYARPTAYIDVENDYYFNRGMGQLLVDKNYGHAESCFKWYLENQGSGSVNMIGLAYYGLGLVSQERKEYERALGYFQLALKNDTHPQAPVSENVYLNVGNIFYKKKEYKDAIECYRKALEINPKNGLVHFYLGMSYLRSGEIDKAEKESAEAKKLGILYTGLDDGLGEARKSASGKEQRGGSRKVKGKNKNVE